MSNLSTTVLNVRPNISAVLDAGFLPAILQNRAYRTLVKDSSEVSRLAIGIERENGLISRADIDVLNPGSAYDNDTWRYVERHIKTLVWCRGGWKIHVSGPDLLCRAVAQAYSPDGARGFDAGIMEKAYDKPMAISIVDAADMPEEKKATQSVGGHLDGCRIGFDLGASDYKLAAVIDGEAVFSTEIPWNPSVQSDPGYHYEHILSGLKLAASHLPRVDAIGGSAAGLYVNNRVKVASLFRSVPEDAFKKSVAPMFLNLQKEFGVPFIVINDGEVTALAGAMSLERKAMLGIAMGSSEAGGFLDRNGSISGEINELAFAPVDFNPNATVDEWSGDSGCGALYFSQQAVNKLAPAAGFKFPEEMLLPERLKEVQRESDAGTESAQAVFSTIGVYLGYSLPHYGDYYDYENLLLLGRVTSGSGGEIILKKAKEVLLREFPDFAERITLHVPDEKSRRVGQAVAAASLPEIK